jgi:hypothetical protein
VTRAVTAVIVARLQSDELAQCVYYDKPIPDSVTKYLRVRTNSGDLPRPASPGPSAARKTLWLTGVGTSPGQAAWVLEQATDVLLNWIPDVPGWSSHRLSQASSQPVDADPEVDNRYFGVDQWDWYSPCLPNLTFPLLTLIACGGINGAAPCPFEEPRVRAMGVRRVARAVPDDFDVIETSRSTATPPVPPPGHRVAARIPPDDDSADRPHIHPSRDLTRRSPEHDCSKPPRCPSTPMGTCGRVRPLRVEPAVRRDPHRRRRRS